MATSTWKLVTPVIVGLAWLSEVTLGFSADRFTFAEPHLGTIVDLTIYAPEESVANEAAKAAFARVKELDLIFSDYKPDSETMRLCQTAGTGTHVKVSSELFDVLKQSVTVSERSEGAFDVTIGPLVTLWRRARKAKTLPTNDEIASAKELVSWKLIDLNDQDKSVELKRAGMRLDFGGIAKGYIAQDVSGMLRRRGLRQTLIAVSGDIVAGDAPPESQGWKIGIAPLEVSKEAPQRLLLLTNHAVSTSGDAYQFVEIGGIRYSHIVDPQTGLGLTQRISVTVVARDGTTADALDTAVCIMGPERGLKLIGQTEGAEVQIVMASEEGVRVIESKAFRRHEQPKRLREGEAPAEPLK